MPELPDITIYIEALQRVVGGTRLDRVRLRSPFLLRSFDPPLEATFGGLVVGFRRMGKRIVFQLEDELFIVVHLMISGRFRWRSLDAAIPSRNGLAAFDFDQGCLLLTEAGSKKRASLHVVRGEIALQALNPGGLEILESDHLAFHHRITLHRHTLKRALTDPKLFSGIGNAYSDEILHSARLSPFKRTDQLTPSQIRQLFDSCRSVLELWTTRLRDEVGAGFPEKVTAFRKGMSVHGRYRKPCPECGTPIQRIAYAGSECNYCARCQTAGKLLADRALSRLLKDDWPSTPEELERKRRGPDSVTRLTDG